MFSRFIGIDYSGAETPDSSLKGLQIASVVHDSFVRPVQPPAGPKKYWTREGIARWLVETLSDGPPAIVGIDHAFSFPIAYFKKYKLAREWPAFLDDFCRHWPTDRPHTYVDFVREEHRLRYIREHVQRPVHFWPFDGWSIPPDRSVIVEVYPRLWRLPVPVQHGFTSHELDAHIIARTLCDADVDGRLERWLAPEMSDDVRADAGVEGWILGADASRLAAAVARDAGSRAGPRARRLSPSAFVSRFFGITVAMYPPFTGAARLGAGNHRGHSIFDVQTARVIEGDLPPVATRLVIEWIETHRSALLENWSRGRSGLRLYRIDPLE